MMLLGMGSRKELRKRQRKGLGEELTKAWEETREEEIEERVARRFGSGGRGGFKERVNEGPEEGTLEWFEAVGWVSN